MAARISRIVTTIINSIMEKPRAVVELSMGMGVYFPPAGAARW
jgi:hypothetical protein